MIARERGLTLVELAVSVGLLGMLILAAMSLLLSTQQASLATGAAINLDQQLRMAMLQLRRDLRRSGWELAPSSGSAGLWAGNQCASPVPDDATETTLGTPTTASMFHSELLVFRQREHMYTALTTPATTTPELDNWTNNETDEVWIRYRLEPWGNFKNVPGTISAFRLVREQGVDTSDYIANLPNTPAANATAFDNAMTTNISWSQMGASISNVEACTFTRVDWNAVEISLSLLVPSPVGDQSGAPPTPIRRKVVETIQLMNTSRNTN